MDRLLLGNIKGTPGNEGKSAYELAVMNGFTGTEQDWLKSLKGEPGVQGPEGPAGTYDILDSINAVKENTEAGKIVDALVIKEVFQSVSEGKATLASAITDKGVPTDASATFQDMAKNIGAILSGSGGGEGGLEGIYDKYHCVAKTSKTNQNGTYTITLEKKYKCAVGILLTLSAMANTNPTLVLNDTVDGTLMYTDILNSYSLKKVIAVDISIAELEANDQYTIKYSFNANSSANTLARGMVFLIK